MRRMLAAGLLLLLLDGCATQPVTIRTVPAETPAADNLAAAANAAAFAEAAAIANAAPPEAPVSKDVAVSPDDQPAPALTPADAPPMYTYDPWERLNRFTYRFNSRFDDAIFLPVVNVYKRVPSPLRAGVHNFFGNVGEITSVINYTLQWRLKYGLRSLERFAINSTIGIGGLIDVATKLKLPGAPSGFATTLSKWGMHPGPYLVLPLLGPSTLRDGFGFAADYATLWGIDPFGPHAPLYRGDQSWGLGVVNSVDQRANVNFRYYSTGSPFEYETIRFLYVRKRLIEDEGLHSKVKDLKNKPSPDAPAGK
jgi:phospholipid-binding lipoprotein MlaA